MSDFHLQPTSTAHWHKLVCDAEQRADRQLGEEVQSYLVFLLQRFLGKPEIAGQVLALDYLKSLYSSGRQQMEKLRDVGDSCLLHAGFFPMRARRRLVNASYYVDLGIGAYYQLHHHTPHHQGNSTPICTKPLCRRWTYCKTCAAIIRMSLYWIR